ncbi:hypothetical protein A2U01_0060336, partial [Trifolium medium]|nr:hypothetical protein [Trifolium medium]
RAACPTIKSSVVNPTSGETPVKSTQACFPPTQSSPSLNVDLPSNGPVKKFTDASFFTDTHARLKTSKKDVPNKVMSVFEVGKLSTMNYMLPKSIQTRLTIDKAYLINRK